MREILQLREIGLLLDHGRSHERGWRTHKWWWRAYCEGPRHRRERRHGGSESGLLRVERPLTEQGVGFAFLAEENLDVAPLEFALSLGIYEV